MVLQIIKTEGIFFNNNYNFALTDKNLDIILLRWKSLVPVK